MEPGGENHGGGRSIYIALISCGKTHQACHAEPVRSASNRSERSEEAHGKLREGAQGKLCEASLDC